MDFELFEGEEWGIDEALIGGDCDGAVAGFGSTGGKLMKAIARRVDAGEFDNARESQFKLIGLFHKIYGSDAGWWCAGQKYALKYMGIISSHTTRVDSQGELPEVCKSIIRECIDANRELLF